MKACTGTSSNVNSRHCTAGLLLLLLASISGTAYAQARVAPAPESSWPSVLDSARKEGRVVLYSQQVPQQIAQIKADFEKAFPGITLEAARLTGTAANIKLDQERAAGVDGGDILITGEVVWLADRAKEGGLRKPIGPAAQSWPAKYLLHEAIPVLGLDLFVIAYNTNLIKTPVSGYQDLLRPEFKGRLGTTEVQAIAIVAFYEWLEKTQGGDFLARLAAQGPRIYTGAVPNAQATASGEVAATTFSVSAVLKPLIENGAPMRIVVPQPGLGLRYGAGIIAGSRRPNASQVLLDYLMSPRGQTAWHSQGISASPLPNIPGSQDASSIQAFDPAVYDKDSVSNYKRKWDLLFRR